MKSGKVLVLIGFMCLVMAACSVSTVRTNGKPSEYHVTIPKNENISSEELADNLTERGNAYFDRNQYEEAAAAFKAASRASPLRAFPHAALGDVYKDQKLNDLSIAEFTIAILMDMRTADIYFCRGIAYFQAEKYQEALSDFLHASQIGPDQAKFHNNTSTTYLVLHDFENTILESNKALEIEPNFIGSIKNRSVAYEETGRHDEAIAGYDIAISFDPNDGETYYNRGVAQMSMKHWDKAISDFGDSIRLKPNNADAYYDRGWIEDNFYNESAAIEDFTKTIEIDPGYAKAYSHLAELYRCRGLIDIARLDLKIAMDFNPTSDIVHDMLLRFDDLSTCEIKSSARKAQK